MRQNKYKFFIIDQRSTFVHRKKLNQHYKIIYHERNSIGRLHNTAEKLLIKNEKFFNLIKQPVLIYLPSTTISLPSPINYSTLIFDKNRGILFQDDYFVSSRVNL